MVTSPCACCYIWAITLVMEHLIEANVDTVGSLHTPEVCMRPLTCTHAHTSIICEINTISVKLQHLKIFLHCLECRFFPPVIFLPKSCLAPTDWCSDDSFFVVVVVLVLFLASLWSYSIVHPWVSLISFAYRDGWKWEEHFHQTDEDHPRQRLQRRGQERFHSARVPEHRQRHPGAHPRHADSRDRLHRRQEHCEKTVRVFHEEITGFIMLHWMKLTCVTEGLIDQHTPPAMLAALWGPTS